MTCRLCKGDHWTSRCPYKDSLGTNTIKELEDSGKVSSQTLVHMTSLKLYAVNKPDAANGPPVAPPSVTPSAGGGAGTKYVPPNQRGGENRRGELMSGPRSNRDGGCGFRLAILVMVIMLQ